MAAVDFSSGIFVGDDIPQTRSDPVWKLVQAKLVHVAVKIEVQPR